MTINRVLVANRGEIAVRLIRGLHDFGVKAVSVHSTDDVSCAHVRLSDEACDLGAAGPRAYLDIDAVIRVALAAGCDAVHPGYGFLSENAEFARRCAQAGLKFIGPEPETLDLFGDKIRARGLAAELAIPMLAGTNGVTTLAEAEQFFTGLPADTAMIVKAVAGGGGRGMRVVDRLEDAAAAMERCAAEATAAFGRGDVYVEQYLPRARHVEIQILGDGTGDVVHLGERECSIQRSHQKIVEIAPAPGMDPTLRDRLCAAAIEMAAAAKYGSLGTFEFLVDADRWGPDAPFYFMEANPRLQVEHTITEEVTGLDLVELQLRIASGESIDDLGPNVRDVVISGSAMQVRVNMETVDGNGLIRPSSGTLEVFEPPTGPGVRVDTFGETGLTLSSRYDSLLAKVIVRHRHDDLRALGHRAERALGEFRIVGLRTNIPLLRRIVTHPAFLANDVTTGFITAHANELLIADEEPVVAAPVSPADADALDPADPLSVLHFGTGKGTVSATPTLRAGRVAATAPEGTVAVSAPIQGTIVSLQVEVGQEVGLGTEVAVIEAMKMEHVVMPLITGVVRSLAVGLSETVLEGDPLVFIEPAEVELDDLTGEVEVDPDHIRPDLQESIDRHGFGLDENRPDAVLKRHSTGSRTARENVEHLIDAGSFMEYGPLVVAAQRARHSEDHLIRATPGDGIVGGVATVNAELAGPTRSRCVVMSYDYMVLAGTQGLQNHRKKDRLFEIAERQQLPVVVFAEGGGGRPGDTDGTGVAGLDCLAFLYFGRLSGLVPLVGITNGRCFAGNAALLGSCDVVIATKSSNIGMGGPAMVEGGGLGIYRPEEIGPTDVQAANGVIDIVVEDEAEAVEAAKKYLSYFQTVREDWECIDQRRLRSAIPENRLRAYEIRSVIDDLCDVDSVLELRADFGVGMVTAFGRVEGRSVGIVANNPLHLGGAIDADGADKAVRFMKLCDGFDIPILFLCDTPGIMVGPQSEETANVRHAARMFVNGANLDVSFFTIVLRKGYGLGAQAMAGGSFHAPVFTVSWPTGEFGGMGLEGAVKLGFRKELEALEDPAERKALYDKMVSEMYQQGKAVNMAAHFEIDGVIDPADSRRWIVAGLDTSDRKPFSRDGKKRPCIDTW